jgi:CIC family chloride channel protein
MKLRIHLNKIRHTITRRAVRLVWFTRKKLPPTQVLALLAIIVGLLTGLMALVLKKLVNSIENLVNGAEQLSTATAANWLPNFLNSLPMLLTPAIGILLTILLVRWVVKDDISHGLSKVLKSIAVGQGRMPPHSSWSYVAACSLTAGFGGSVGMEAPIVATGSGIGSNIGRLFRLGYRYRVVLIGCGAAAAVSAVFKAPIAGLILAIEVLAIELSAWAILPLLLASASAAVLSMGLTDKTHEFSFAVTDLFLFTSIPWFVILGLLCGLVSVLFTRISWLIEDVFRPWSKRTRFLVGAGLVGLLVFLFPPLFGEGYAPMKALLSGQPTELAANPLYAAFLTLGPSSGNAGLAAWLFLGYLVLVLIFKLVSTPLTTASGGIGGIFAPSLFLGCFTGWIFALATNLSGLPGLLGINALSTQNLALVGMAGVMSGVMHAPLTAIFLIAEITGGYNLFIPLIITSAISHYTIRHYERHSVYTRKLAAEGHLITTERDRSALGLLTLAHFIRQDAPVISPSTTLETIVSLIRESSSEILVVSEAKRFYGFIFVDNIRQVIFVPESYQLVCAQDLMEPQPITLRQGQTMSAVLEHFATLAGQKSSDGQQIAASGSDIYQYLPVLDAENCYMGFVCHSDILEAYRQKILDMSGDPEDDR